jgi:hypothetical protein
MRTSNTARNMLIFLLMALGVGAIFGGGVLVLSPSGAWLGMPLSMLRYSHFNNFLVPGIILMVVLGIGPVALSWALIRKPTATWMEKLNVYPDMYWGWTYTIYTAFTLMIWIQMEMTILRAVHWSHTVYLLLAMTIIFVALLPPVRNHYKQKA